MRSSLSILTLGTIASSAVAQKVVPLSFSRGGSSHNGLHKRTGTYSEELNNNLTGGGYYAQVALGTPPQPVTLILDTGSSDVWVLDTHADLCRSRALSNFYGSCLDSYNPESSSTYQLAIPGGFDISYVDGSGAKGDYIKDTLSVGGASIKALQVGLATQSTINSGLLGIGFDTNVAAKKVYRNIIDLFVDEKLIQSQAYSLYLNDLQAETGTVLFGGIDTEKFIGKLQTIDILLDPQSGIYSSFTVSLDSLTLGSTSGKKESENFLGHNVLVVLDSGTTLTYLPTAVANVIFQQFNAVDDSMSSGLVYVSCDVLKTQKDVTFDFQFGGSSGPIIRVPIREVVLDNVKGFVDIGLQLPHLPFTNVCSFGIQAMSGVYLLGDTFLRSAYVVYDLTNKQIGLAQSNVQATKSNVVEITPSGIPALQGVASQVPVPSSTSSSGSGSGSGSSSGSGSGSNPNSTSDSSKSPAARIAPAMNWEVAAVTLVAGFFGFAGANIFLL